MLNGKQKEKIKTDNTSGDVYDEIRDMNNRASDIESKEGSNFLIYIRDSISQT